MTALHFVSEAVLWSALLSMGCAVIPETKRERRSNSRFLKKEKSASKHDPVLELMSSAQSDFDSALYKEAKTKYSKALSVLTKRDDASDVELRSRLLQSLRRAEWLLEDQWRSECWRALGKRRRTLVFKDERLSQVIRRIQKETWVPFSLESSKSVAARRVTGCYENVTLGETLCSILAQVNCALEPRSRTLAIVSPRQTHQAKVSKIYDISELLREFRRSGPVIQLRTDDSDQVCSFGHEESEEGLSDLSLSRLVETVKDLTGRHNWTEPGTIQVEDRYLHVFQTDQIHSQVAEKLALLREGQIYTQFTIHFVSIPKDYLRQIGVDYQRSTRPRRGILGAELLQAADQETYSEGDRVGIQSESEKSLADIVLGQADLQLAGRKFYGSSLESWRAKAGRRLKLCFLTKNQVNAVFRLSESEQRTRRGNYMVASLAMRERGTIRAMSHTLSPGRDQSQGGDHIHPVPNFHEEGMMLSVIPIASETGESVTLELKMVIQRRETQIEEDRNSQGSSTLLSEASFGRVTLTRGQHALIGGLDEFVHLRPETEVARMLTRTLVSQRTAEERGKRYLLMILSARAIKLREIEKKVFGSVKSD